MTVNRIPERRRKSPQERDPNWTPTQWMKENMQLRCEYCGDRIKLDSAYFAETTWEDAEKWAELARTDHEHKCSALHKAKDMMQAYRAKYPNISFEESIKIYNMILEQLKV